MRERAAVTRPVGAPAIEHQLRCDISLQAQEALWQDVDSCSTAGLSDCDLVAIRRPFDCSDSTVVAARTEGTKLGNGSIVADVSLVIRAQIDTRLVISASNNEVCAVGGE